MGKGDPAAAAPPTVRLPSFLPLLCTQQSVAQIPPRPFKQVRRQASPNHATIMSNAVFRLVVAGAHMSGLRLNHQLTDLGGQLWKAVKTAPVYRKLGVDGGLVLRRRVN